MTTQTPKIGMGAEEIRPRWDWKFADLPEEREDRWRRNQTKVGLKDVNTELVKNAGYQKKSDQGGIESRCRCYIYESGYGRRNQTKVGLKAHQALA